MLAKYGDKPNQLTLSETTGLTRKRNKNNKFSAKDIIL